MDSPQPAQMAPKKGNSSILWVVLVIVLLAAIVVAVYAYWNKNQNSNTNVNQNTNVAVNSNVNTSSNQNVNSASTNSAVNTNTAADTSQWETFSSSKYGFSVKMPQSWQVTQTSVNRDAFKYESFGVNPGEGTHAGYQVNVYNSVKDLADGANYSTLAEWITTQTNGPYAYPPTDFLGQGTYEGFWPSADETYSFYIEHGGRVYNINMSWISPETRATDPTTKRAVFNSDEEAFLKSFKLLQ